MSGRETYAPGAATGATVRKDRDTWTLVLVRELRHPAAKVWKALTDPAELCEWAPFDADRSLGATGPVKLSTVAAPTPHVSETVVTRAEAPRLLCLDVLDHFLSDHPIGRIVAGEFMKFGWKRLTAEYAEQFGIEGIHTQRLERRESP